MGLKTGEEYIERFSGNPLTHFTPADFIAGMYAGIAWMKLSESPG